MSSTGLTVAVVVLHAFFMLDGDYGTVLDISIYGWNIQSGTKDFPVAPNLGR
jgi:hypothetical protein